VIHSKNLLCNYIFNPISGTLDTIILKESGQSDKMQLPAKKDGRSAERTKAAKALQTA
jgi:hypothetical protein